MLKYVGIHKSKDHLTKRKIWSRSSKITGPRISLAHTTLPPVQWIVSTIVYRALLMIMENAQRRLYRSQRELIQLNTRLLLTQFFFHAELAALNCLLNKEGLINGHM